MISAAVRRAGLAIALVPVALGTTTATASAKPKVNLSFAPQGADAGAPIAFSYTATGLPRKSKLVIQRPMGTAGKYKTVSTLQKTATGSGSLPAMTLGQYSYQVAVTRKKRGKTKVLARKKAGVRVFGDVTFAQLFNRTENTKTTPSNSFS